MKPAGDLHFLVFLKKCLDIKHVDAAPGKRQPDRGRLSVQFVPHTRTPLVPRESHADLTPWPRQCCTLLDFRFLFVCLAQSNSCEAKTFAIQLTCILVVGIL